MAGPVPSGFPDKPAVPVRSVAVGIFVCFLIAAIEGYDIQAFGVAAPKLVAEFGLTARQMGFAATAAMVGLVIGAFAGGFAADRVGRKPVLIAAVLAFGGCSIWTGFTNDYPMLLAARLATGVGFGAAMPNLIAIAADIAKPSRRGATTSAMFCGMPLGGAAVSLAANLLGDDLAWRTLFLIGGGLPVVLTPVILMLLPETRPVRDPAADRRMLLALFGEGRAVPTLLLWVANLLTLVVLYLLLNWLPALMVAKGHTASEGAAASLAFNLLGATGALMLGFAVDRLSYRNTFAGAYALLAVAMAVMATASALGLLVALAGAVGFLVMGSQYALYGLAPQVYRPEVRAAGAGAAVGIGRFGSIIGPLMAGELRGAGWTADQVILALAPIVIAAGAAAVILASRSKAEAK